MIYFLSLNEVLEIHEDQLLQYGGAHGIRNQELLLSALAQPPSQFAGQYLHKDLFEMGSAYLYHLCQNHPFVDGNKRTALASALMFLLSNDIEIEIDNDLEADMVMEVASGKMLKKDVADWFRQYKRSATKVWRQNKQQ